MQVCIVYIGVFGVRPELRCRKRMPEGGSNQVIIGMIVGTFLAVSRPDGDAEYPAVKIFTHLVGERVMIAVTRITLIGQFPRMDMGRITPPGLKVTEICLLQPAGFVYHAPGTVKSVHVV